MSDTTKRCATGCGKPTSPGAAGLCREHDDEWLDSKEAVRSLVLMNEYPPLQDRSKEQADEMSWRQRIALGDFVKRIAVEVSAVKLGKVVPPKAK